MPRGRKKSNSVSVDLGRNWGWLVSLGTLFVILGCIGLSMVVTLTLFSIFFIGVLFLIAGVAQIVDAFKSRAWRGVAWHVLIAILYLIAGVLIIYDPLLASAVITALIAWTFIIVGVLRLFMAGTLRHGHGWGWLIVGGIISIILGVLILLQWPFSALWLIGLFVAIELLVNGWIYIFMAFGIRRTR